MGGYTLLLLLPLLATCHAQFQFHEVSGVGEKVKVKVYFSSLCSDSVNFFRTQLYPTWQILKDIMDLEFIPYGKARATPTNNGDYSFVCQHGDDECEGNKVMACAVNSLTINEQVEYLSCMMGLMRRTDLHLAGSRCNDKTGISWKPINDCARSLQGSSLLYQNGYKTALLKPRVYFIPTITINERYDSTSLSKSQHDLTSQVCEAYQGFHSECL